MTDFTYQEIFELAAAEVPYRQLSSDHVSTADMLGERVLRVEAEALTLIAAEAMRDMAHLFRPCARCSPLSASSTSKR